MTGNDVLFLLFVEGTLIATGILGLWYYDRCQEKYADDDINRSA